MIMGIPGAGPILTTMLLTIMPTLIITTRIEMTRVANALCASPLS
jgi:hypothetical protein